MKIEFYKETNFKQTQLGKMPTDWDIIRFGENFVEIEIGKRAKGGALTEGTVASIGGEHIDDRGNILWGDMKFIPEDFYESLNQGKVKLGDILLVKDGATTGKVALLRELHYEKVAVNEHVFLIRSKVDRLLNEFLYYFLFSKFGQIQIKTRFHGLIGGIVREDLEKVLIPYPPVVEQRAIAEVLSVVDLAIQRTDMVIAKTERLKKGLMQELLTKGIGHKEFKDTEIGKIPINWEIKKVADLFSVETGTTPSTKNSEYWQEGEVNWFTPLDLSKLNGKIRIRESERKITRKALKDYNLTLIPLGSLILSTRAPVGYVAVLEEGGTFNQGCKGLIPRDKEIESLFYAYYLLHKKDVLQNLSGGSTFKELSKTMLENVKVPLPPIVEQRAIAEILSVVDQKLEFERKERERLERIKQGLMDLLLTGKVRIRVDMR
ncbi:MAG: restriction endonuclease subunit S [Nitrososphaerota archaeon]